MYSTVLPACLPASVITVSLSVSSPVGPVAPLVVLEPVVRVVGLVALPMIPSVRPVRGARPWRTVRPGTVAGRRVVVFVLLLPNFTWVVLLSSLLLLVFLCGLLCGLLCFFFVYAVPHACWCVSQRCFWELGLVVLGDHGVSILRESCHCPSTHGPGDLRGRRRAAAAVLFRDAVNEDCLALVGLASQVLPDSFQHLLGCCLRSILVHWLKPFAK